MLLNRGCGCLSKYTSPVLANHAFKSCSGCLEAPGLERKANASKGLRLLSPLVRSRYDLHKMRHVGLDDVVMTNSSDDKHYISPPTLRLFLFVSEPATHGDGDGVFWNNV